MFEDERGFFLESWNESAFRDSGIDAVFTQDNHSRSAAGVLRGLHFQNPNAQGKLVRVTNGSAFDVAVDLRRSSPNFARWVGVELSAANKRQFWIPEGFAHGFLSLENDTDLLYKCTANYAPADEHVLAWNDPEIAIDWPIDPNEVRLSERDKAGMPLSSLAGFA